MSHDASPPATPWATMLRELGGLRELVEAGEPAARDALAVAKAFAATAQAYHAAIVATGSSSLRMQAVCKALDLRTPKSALQAFAGDGR